MKYVYPAIIRHDLNDGVYYVHFPDLESCFTDGATMHEALVMGEDILNSMLSDYKEVYEKDPPVPSDINALKHADNEVLTLIKADTEEYKHEAMRYKIAEVIRDAKIPEMIIETVSEALNEGKANML